MQNMVVVKATRDFFTSKFLFMSLAPFIVPIIILGSFFIYGSGEFITMLEDGARSGDFSFLDESVYPISAYILSFSVVQWLLIGIFAVIGTLGVVLLSLIIAVLTVGILTPKIVKTIKARNYTTIPAGVDHGFLKSLGNISKIFLKFLLFLLCTIPFLFVPFLNFVFFQVPFFYLFYNLMMYDMISTGISKDVEKVIKDNKIYLLTIMMLFFFLSVIPLLGLLLQVFFIVFLSHFILTKTAQNITEGNN